MRLWVFPVLFLVLIASADLTAQDRASSFEEVASEAAAARDVDDAPRAIELYRQAVQLNPKWEEGWWFLGLLQYGTRSYASATEALSRFLELNPNAGQALALRGLCEFESGAYPQSLADIQNGIAAGAAEDAQHAQALHYHEAILLTRLGKFQDALRVYIIIRGTRAVEP